MQLTLEQLTLLKKVEETFGNALSSCGLEKIACPDNSPKTSGAEEKEIRGDSKGFISQGIEAITSLLATNPLTKAIRDKLHDLKVEAQKVLRALDAGKYLDAYEGLRKLTKELRRFSPESSEE